MSLNPETDAHLIGGSEIKHRPKSIVINGVSPFKGRPANEPAGINTGWTLLRAKLIFGINSRRAAGDPGGQGRNHTMPPAERESAVSACEPRPNKQRRGTRGTPARRADINGGSLLIPRYFLALIAYYAGPASVITRPPEPRYKWPDGRALR